MQKLAKFIGKSATSKEILNPESIKILTPTAADKATANTLSEEGKKFMETANIPTKTTGKKRKVLVLAI